MTYNATDDDLPDFFRDGSLPKPPKKDVRKVAEQAVLHHYPQIAEKQQRREARALAKAQRDGVRLQERKQYVKRAKKLQMWDWLRGLKVSFPIMRQREREFYEGMLLKFEKYTAYNVKWVTENQYQWLKNISTTYLRVPHVD
jgi:hypothetical protein